MKSFYNKISLIGVFILFFGFAQELSAQITQFSVTGSTNCAQGSGFPVGLSGAQGGVTYHLKQNGQAVPGASPIYAQHQYTSISWSVQYIGTYTVSATKPGESTTQMTGQAVITSNAGTINSSYSLSGAGTYCWGDVVTAALSGFQYGVTYTLYKNGTAVPGSSKQYAGSNISWIIDISNGSGNYTVKGSNECLSNVSMNGSATITFVSQPTQHTFVGGGEYCDVGSGSGATIQLLTSTSGVNYQLYKGGTQIGASKAGNGSVLEWTVTQAGSDYMIKALTSNGCGSIDMTKSSSSFSGVVVKIPPLQKTISQGGTYCWDESTILTLNNSQSGVTYRLYKNGTLVSGQPAQVGTGSNLNWTLSASDGSGTYTVKGSNDCSTDVLMGGTSVVTFTPEPGLPTGSNQSQCGSGLITITATPGSNANTVRWYSLPGGGSVLHEGNNYEINLTSNKTYYAASYNTTTGCESSTRKAISITMNTVPSLASGTGVSRCGDGTLTLTASPGSGGDNIHWYTASTGGSLVGTGTSYTTSSLSSTTTYYAASFNSSTGCEDPDRRAIVATVNVVPALASGSDVSRCGAGTLTLTASPGAGGNSIRWYDAAVEGTMVGTGMSYTTPSLNSTTTYYAASYNTTTGCEDSDRKAIVATVNPLPGLPTGSNQSQCGSGLITITATPGSNSNTVRWYSLPGGGSVLHEGNNYEINLTSNKTYYAASYNTTTGCESSTRKAISITMNTVPSLASGTGVSRCGDGTLTLTASPGSGGDNIHWYTASTGGSLVGTGTSYTTSSLSSTTTYYAASFNSSTGCEDPDRRAIVATVNVVPALASGSDVSRCGAGTLTLTASPGAGGNSIRWYDAAVEGTIVGTGTSYTTPSLNSTTTYYAASYNTTTGCEDSDRIAIAAVVTLPPSGATVTGGGAYCPGSSSGITINGMQVGYTYKLFRNDVLVPGAQERETLSDGASFTWSGLTAAGNYSVKAYQNGCVYDITNNSTSVSSIASPVAQTVNIEGNGNGEFCWDAIVRVTLAAYESDVTYTLYKDNVAQTHQPQIDAGVLTFTLQKLDGDGFYSIKGIRAGCAETDMANNVGVLFGNAPQQFSVTGGGLYCKDDYSTISLSGSELGKSYDLLLDGSTVIDTWSGDGNAKDWVVRLPGNYSVVVNLPDCGQVLMTDNTSSTVGVNVITPPELSNVSACIGDNVVLTATGAPTGGTYNWYESIGGSVIHTGPTLSTVANTSKVYFVKTELNGCESTESTVTLVARTKPIIPVVNDQVKCSDGSFTFLAATREGETFEWYDESGTTLLHTGDAFTTPTLTTTTSYQVKAVGGICYSPVLTVTATINVTAQPPVPQVIQDCHNYYLRLSGSAPNDVTYYWQGINNDGFERLYNTSADYLVTENGTYYVKAYDSAKDCWSETTSVVVNLANTDRITPVDCNGVPPALDNLPITNRLLDDEPYNYVKTYTAFKDDLTIETIVTDPKENSSLVSAYFDGLGRPLQTVRREGSPVQGNDQVELFFFDEYGRQSRQYLPYTNNANTGSLDLNSFDNQSAMLSQKHSGETVFYGLTRFDDSPNNRSTKQMRAGNSWAGSNVGVESTYLTNLDVEGVRIWSVDGNNNPISNGVYPTATLRVLEVRDENGNLTREYTDKLGRLVLKKEQNLDDPSSAHLGWLNTYYVYDNLGQLNFVLPPKAVEGLEANSWVYSTSVENLVFKYQYDGRGREIIKQTPGAGMLEKVYDKLDRLVASRTANQRLANSQASWSFSKFDEHNRVVMSGFYYSAMSRADLQLLIDGGTFSANVSAEIPAEPGAVEGANLVLASHQPGTTKYKARDYIEFLPGFDSGTGEFETSLDQNLSVDNHEGYNDNSFPAINDGTEVDLIEINYYDDYRFTTKTFDTSFPAFSDELHSVVPQQYTDAMGLRTGTKLRVLGTDQWLENVYFYDEKNRVVQQRMDNKNAGEKVETRQYDFVGKVLQTHVKHTNPLADVSETKLLTKNTYDHAGRLTKVEQGLNDESELKVLATYDYGALGELEKRTLGDDLETLNYQYNLHGWLTSVNGEDLNNTGIMEDHFFSMGLSYDYGFSSVQKNGNISGVKWKTKTDPVVRAFGYDYDRLDRLNAANYSDGANWDNLTDDYTIDNVAYDLNGNITSMNRLGVIGGVTTSIDALGYTYRPESLNQLLKVEDSSLSAEGFDNFNGAMNDYVYDANGNLISDENKGIESVEYNHLNLPSLVTMYTDNPSESRSVKYTYDANGRKLSEETNDNGEITSIDYIDGFIYENNTLKMFSHAEGRIRKTSTGMVRDYYIKDHLNNTRMTLTEDQKKSVYLATMETDVDAVEGVDLGVYEGVLFNNLDAARATYNNANYTVNLNINANEVARLNGNDPNRRIGPGKMLVVSTGDIVDLEAFAYYEGSAGTTSPLDAVALASAVATVFGGAQGGTLEQQFIHDQFSVGNGAIAVGAGVEDDSQPRAYLNYVFFDENFDYVDGGFVQVNAQAQNILPVTSGNVQHQHMEIQRSITQNGYLFVYVSNETDADFNVYFDDLRITHTQGTILQEDHFYPFGMRIKALSFNAPGLEGLPSGDKLGLGWNDLGFRNYDATLGRFFNTDPMGELTVKQSTYQFAANNPVKNTDVLGLFGLDIRREYQSHNSATQGGFENFVIQSTLSRLRQKRIQDNLDANDNDKKKKTDPEPKQLDDFVVTAFGPKLTKRVIASRIRAAEEEIKSLKRAEAAEVAYYLTLVARFNSANSKVFTPQKFGTNGQVNALPTENSIIDNSVGRDEKTDDNMNNVKKLFSPRELDPVEVVATAEPMITKPYTAMINPDLLNFDPGLLNNGNFTDNTNKESKNTTTREPMASAYQIDLGENGAEITPLIGETDTDNSQSGSYDLLLNGNPIRVKIKAVIHMPGTGEDVKIEYESVVGSNLSNEQSTELSETLAKAAKAYLGELVRNERSELETSSTRQAALERIKADLNAFVDTLVGKMNNKSFGAKFFADQLELNPDKYELLLEIQDELDEMGPLDEDYDYEAFAQQDLDYALYYDLGFYGFDLQQYLAGLKTFNDNFDIIKAQITITDDTKKMLAYIHGLSDLQLSDLDPAYKIRAMEVITQERITGANAIETMLRISAVFPQGEEVILRLLRNTNPEDYSALLSSFSSVHNTGLLDALDNGFDDTFNGSNYGELISEFIKMSLASLEDDVFADPANPTSAELNLYIENLGGQNKSFMWDGNTDFSYSTSIDGLNQVTINESRLTGYQYSGQGGQQPIFVSEPTRTFDPFEPIVITSQLENAGINLARGQIVVVPAIALHYLNQDDWNKAMRNNVYLAIDVASFFVSAGALNAGVKGYRAALAVLDMAVSVADAAVIINEDNIVSQYGAEGQEFIDNFNIIAAVIGLGTIGLDNVPKIQQLQTSEAIEGFRRFWKKNSTDVDLPIGNDLSQRLNQATKEQVFDEITDVNLENYINDAESAGAFLGTSDNADEVVTLMVTRAIDDGTQTTETLEEVAKVTKNTNGDDVFEITSTRIQDKMTASLSATEEAALRTDLAADFDLAQALHENPELIDAWKTLDDAGVDNALRKDVAHVVTVDDFIKSNSINPDVLKNELQNLTSHHEAFLEGLALSNNSTDLSLVPKITIKNPNIDTDGTLLGTYVNGTLVVNGNTQVAGKWDYIVKADGEILVGRKHSFMSQGSDVLAAGELKFNNGVLVDINNLSGHYLPDQGEAFNFLRIFKKQGVNVDNAFLSIYNSGGSTFRQVPPSASFRKLYE